MSRLAALTGASGFIGGHALEALAARGWRLRILARRWPVLPTELGSTEIEVVQGDLADDGALARLVAGADAVVHLAGVVKAADPTRFDAVNAVATGRLAALWRAHAPDARFLLLSSMAARQPRISPYAASKQAGERALIAAAGQGDWRILRPAAVYGPGDRETLAVFRLADLPVQPMLNGPDARLCLVHAADLAGAIAVTLEEGETRTSREVTDARTDGYRWEEIATHAARALGRAPRPVQAPPWLVRAVGAVGSAAARLTGGTPLPDADKVREMLHADWSSCPDRQLPPHLWAPQIGLSEGFCGTVSAYRKAGWLRQRR